MQGRKVISSFREFLRREKLAKAVFQGFNRQESLQVYKYTV